MQTPHKRRVRYKGKYPKNLRKNIRSCSRKNIKRRLSISFKKGNTPAGTHRPICVEEILSFLDVKPDRSVLTRHLAMEVIHRRFLTVLRVKAICTHLM